MWYFFQRQLALSAITAGLALPFLTEAVDLPPASTAPVDFVRDIKPILEASCTKCHGRGKDKGDFRIDTRETLLHGGETGAAVVPGKSAESYLIKLVAGVDPDNVMPQKGSRLTPHQVGLLRAWIDQDLPWDQTVTFAKPAPLNLQPRRPELPPASPGWEHPVDRFVGRYFGARAIAPPHPVSDRVFARRVYLDILGLLPPKDELESFVGERSPGKRAQLVRRLLGDRQRFAEHWLTFWNDVLRNDYKGTGYIDGGRKQITPWLFSALATNLPFDQFVARLINPDEHSEGFAKGIIWRGVVNASQAPEMQAAQNIAQVFMGVNLKCASCHDSFINDWTLADAYGMANIYAEKPLEIAQCEKPTGKTAQSRFLYPELGQIDGSLTKTQRLERLAELLCRPSNGRLPRTIVNRFWERFLGRGLVEPLDDMEQPAWDPDLLDWLAEDFAAHQYDLNHLIETILTSRAYQLPAVNRDDQPKKEFVFHGPAVRRLSAEQFVDAISALTGVWKTMPANTEIDFSAGGRAASTDPAKTEATVLKAPARWIWKDELARTATAPGTIHFRKQIELPDSPDEAAMVVTCDNAFTLYINGKEAGSSREWKKPKVIDIRAHLVKGPNVIAISAVNDPLDEKKKDAMTGQENAAGLFCYARIRYVRPESAVRVERVMDFGSDTTWLCTGALFRGWRDPGFEPEGWIPAAELGGIAADPWQAAERLLAALSAADQYNRVRAALVAADPLMTALGRPNREQLITSRSMTATTLQALELTNGATLAELLKRGAEKLLRQFNPDETQRLVEALYLNALGRTPSKEESTLARELLGQPITAPPLEDFLWTVAMLPEFQLIY